MIDFITMNPKYRTKWSSSRGDIPVEYVHINITHLYMECYSTFKKCAARSHRKCVSSYSKRKIMLHMATEVHIRFVWLRVSMLPMVPYGLQMCASQRTTLSWEILCTTVKMFCTDKLWQGIKMVCLVINSLLEIPDTEGCKSMLKFLTWKIINRQVRENKHFKAYSFLIYPIHSHVVCLYQLSIPMCMLMAFSYQYIKPCIDGDSSINKFYESGFLQVF